MTYDMEFHTQPRITALHWKTVKVKLTHQCQMSCANRRQIPIEVLRVWEVCFYYSLINTIVRQRERPTVYAEKVNLKWIAKGILNNSSGYGKL